MREAFIQARNKQREKAREFLSGLGCLHLPPRAPHEMHIIADSILVHYSAKDHLHKVVLNGYDLSHIVNEAHFIYVCKIDVPVVKLIFQPRLIAPGVDMPVFREDEHLMRAGILVKAQSDDTEVMILVPGTDTRPSLSLDYTEDKDALVLSGLNISGFVQGFSLGVNFRYRTISLGSNIKVR